jgi:CRISPR-associated endonuclease/helicase Cas3
MEPRFWAKTGRGELQANGQPKYHPVICHLADTAAVATEIVRNGLSPVAINTLEKGLGITGESLVKSCGFLAGCHDLGKVSPAFQFQVDLVAKELMGSNLYDLWHNMPALQRQGKVPHGTVTAKTLPNFLGEWGMESSLAKKLAALVGGHHGFFPSNQEINQLDELLAGVNEGTRWKMFSREIFEQLINFVKLQPQDLPIKCSNAAAMILAGLTTVSDWIASNPDLKTGFPYANDMPFEEYQLGLQAKAQNALQAIGWKTPQADQPLAFSQLFPQISQPRELQHAAIAISQDLDAPCLVLVEAAMGEGKTEAALYLADYLQHQGGAGGFYIGLPTQATSNAMFNRVKAFLEQRYSTEIINLTLSHAAAALKDEYQNMICRLDEVYDDEAPTRASRVVAGEWHTARKRTLLSPYGVGTIDQALMGAVRSKHQFVRLFGLAGRVVILDEIHAYDIYTSRLLERFLEWLALLGSPVIALSATLPQQTRQRLVDAYAQGCGGDPPKPQASAYPRLTTFTPTQGLQVRSFNASPHVTRGLNLTWVTDGDWQRQLKQNLSVAGGCVAVICSTIGRAQKVFEQLRADFNEDELSLFHGRFLFCDRERIEQDCIVRFGKPDDPKTQRPKRYVLVATQVIEQSLDLDFDLIISDIAPIDLLLQRSGRLHRHAERTERPAQLAQPTVWLIQPQRNEKGALNFDAAGFIYDRHVLLRTWLTLGEQTQLTLPGQMDDLIEAVYQPIPEPPDGLDTVDAEDWRTSFAEYQTDDRRDGAKADAVKLPSGSEKDLKPSDYTRQGEEDSESQIAAVTRLGEKSVTTIFVEKTKTGLVLPGTEVAINLNIQPNLNQIRELLAYSTRISKRGLVEELEKQSNPGGWTSALLRNCRHVVLENSVVRVGGWELRLDAQKGVVIGKV